MYVHVHVQNSLELKARENTGFTVHVHVQYCTYVHTMYTSYTVASMVYTVSLSVTNFENVSEAAPNIATSFAPASTCCRITCTVYTYTPTYTCTVYTVHCTCIHTYIYNYIHVHVSTCIYMYM